MWWLGGGKWGGLPWGARGVLRGRGLLGGRQGRKAEDRLLLASPEVSFSFQSWSWFPIHGTPTLHGLKGESREANRRPPLERCSDMFDSFIRSFSLLLIPSFTHSFIYSFSPPESTSQAPTLSGKGWGAGLEVAAFRAPSSAWGGARGLTGRRTGENSVLTLLLTPSRKIGALDLGRKCGLPGQHRARRKLADPGAGIFLAAGQAGPQGGADASKLEFLFSI